jgi:hypothetical protein
MISGKMDTETTHPYIFFLIQNTEFSETREQLINLNITLDQKPNLSNYHPTKDERNQKSKVCHSKNFWNEYSHARGVEVKTKAATPLHLLARAPELLAVDTQASARAEPRFTSLARPRHIFNINT